MDERRFHARFRCGFKTALIGLGRNRNLQANAARRPVVFVSEPVQPGAALRLAAPASVAQPPPGFQPLLEWVGGLDVTLDPTELLRVTNRSWSAGS